MTKQNDCWHYEDRKCIVSNSPSPQYLRDCPYYEKAVWKSKSSGIREGLKTIILLNVETNTLGDIVFKVDGLSNVLVYLKSQRVVRVLDNVIVLEVEEL